MGDGTAVSKTGADLLGNRRFESNELSPGGTAIVPRPHYDAHGASAECADLFELAVYRPRNALESGLIAHHRAALLSDVSEEERSPGEAPRARSRNGAGRYLAPDARQDGNEIEFLSREVFSGRM